MHDNTALIEGRLRRSLDRIREQVYSERAALDVAAWQAPGEPVPVADGLAAPYAPVRVGAPWGPAWSTTWFRFTGRVPKPWAGRTVQALVDLGFDRRRTGFHAEGLVYTAAGRPLKGLNPRSQWVRVGSPAEGGEPVRLYVEGAANPMILGDDGMDFRPTELGDLRTAGPEPLYRLVRAELAVFEQEVWELQQDLEVLGQLAAELPARQPRRWQVLAAIDRALDRLDGQAVDATASAARAELAEVLAASNSASVHRLSAVGHAHIDSAWLWPTRETVRKVARTAANVTDLMDHHPELVFAMSSAQQFAWLAEHRPEVWQRVKEKVAAGQFVPVGGMWVESDTNLPGGEALARQLAYGKRFFLEELGVETREVWLPDSFGYSAALPQLIALSGSRWLLSQKISWNQTNSFPHHSFLWEGLDGTRIFTHFPPVDTYNAELTGAELAHASDNFADKAGATTSLVPFGHGDGGGGPTREMVARAARLRDLEGSPRLVVEPPARFFARAEAEYADAPVWSGELYLEYHRGTYTSQARTKRGNRRCEHLLREAELWCATATVRRGTPYPSAALDRIWKRVLLQQFHDILPGSSIRWVHREAVAHYEAAQAELEQIIAQALATLAGPGETPLVANAAPHGRGGVPALGLGPPAAAAAAPVRVRGAGAGYVLDNELVRVTVDGDGLLSSVRDLVHDREVLAPGTRGNLLQLHPDTPNAFDAWDIDAFYRHTSHDLTDLDAMSPTAQGVRVRRRIGTASTVEQEIALSPGTSRVEVTSEVDWHESEKLLKVGFDLDVAAARSAAETQFGHLFRPTHTNTSWDAAKFETCAHRWVHVGEPDYGIALVTDSTYGHDLTRRPRQGGGTSTQVRLSLLRAPRSPDPDADQGLHRMGYALVPGATIPTAVREGYWFNLPERHLAGAGPVEPLVRVAPEGVVVESVKLAHDGTGDVVVRLYEAHGNRTRALVEPGFPATRVQLVDLLERPVPEADELSRPGRVELELGPFQIRTLRFSRAR